MGAAGGELRRGHLMFGAASQVSPTRLERSYASVAFGGSSAFATPGAIEDDVQSTAPGAHGYGSTGMTWNSSVKGEPKPTSP
jgi:hypothetical protein